MLPDPTSLLMKEIPSSVISVANNDIESLMKASSTKMLFIKVHVQRQDIYAYYFGILA